jgi:hypothetical protein
VLCVEDSANVSMTAAFDMHDADGDSVLCFVDKCVDSESSSYVNRYHVTLTLSCGVLSFGGNSEKQ